MTKAESILKHLGKWLAKPVLSNGAFLVFMFLLGTIVTFIVLPDGTKVYDHWATELLTDVFAFGAILCLVPDSISLVKRRFHPRLWLKRLFYVASYAVSLIDVVCYEKFDSTLTPTMLLLVGETNSQEAGEFLQSFFSFDLFTGRAGWILLLLLVHILWAIARKVLKTRLSCFQRIKDKLLQKTWAAPVIGILTFVIGIAFWSIFAYSIKQCWTNKKAFHRLMSYERIGEVEHELTTRQRAQLFLPFYRLAFSVRANQLTARQLTHLTERIDSVRVDSCSFTSPNIVLIIGESYSKHHAQLYGYERQNTPRQVEWAKRGELIPYQDVVAPWNLTSFVFKHIFSLYTVGDRGEWCDYPLFPEVFRKAGYHVTFLTNQFLPQAKEAVYDFSGGFFLNNPQLSAAMFDSRNDKLTYFDDGLLRAYDRLKKENTNHNLIIFHLKGQHVEYRTRCPKSMQHLTADDYDRPNLSHKERQMLAYYDNAVAYNDSILDQIIRRFEHDDAIIIHVPDHGEEVFDDDVHFFCRLHSARITRRLARLEFEIPFWFYATPLFRERHPDLFRQVADNSHRRFMTDALPYMLLYLAGIHTPDYRDELNVLSPAYNEKRPRILKNTTDYDKLFSADEK